MTRAWVWRGTALASLALLGACGGGGGVASTPTPIATVDPTPTPTPAATPTPTPTTASTNYDTSEYRATVGAVSMNALAAYNSGATGKGIGLAIIDTGIDTSSAEFDNRISAASAPVGGETSVKDEGGHGTAVAFTAAGRRNGAFTHGVAFEATVIALRADRQGSCGTASTDDADSGCKFGSDAIAAGVDAARAAGARVINMSLGGTTMPPALQAAIGRATAAGIVVVIAAGNDGTANPDPFTSVAGGANANGAVIVAGSVGAGGASSSFSDKAGTAATTYIAAVGERVRAPDQTGTAFLWSGTSFAAPQIAAAVALLAQAFPNLSGQQIVDLLFTTARDAGTAGTDAIYGRGILDLTRAFQPQGTTSVAGSTLRVATAGANGQTSAPMGDASPSGVGAVILDGYGRAFAIDLAATLARQRPAAALAPALASASRQVAFTTGDTAVAMTLAPARGGGVLLEPTHVSFAQADAARAVAVSVARRLDARTSVAFGMREGAAGLEGGLAGRAEPAFLVATGEGTGFDSTARASVAVRRQLGSWGLTVAAEQGDVLTPAQRLLPGRSAWQRDGYSRASVSLDRRLGPVTATLAAARLDESGTVIGARLGPAWGNPDATSWFATAAARLDAGGGWTLGGSWRHGRTDARLHGLAGDGRLATTAFAVDVGKRGLFGGGDWGLRLAQPLRVASGGLDLLLPTGWDYATGTVSATTAQHLSLAPVGRELDAEMRYSIALGGGALATNLYWRRDPGNWASLPADRGAALRWSRGF